ncbi:DEAD/DEAH box helicase [Microbispora sp. ATCC PTA-5024]|uniref:DEAD/DEAH box helicase n=1 Tax=Microbispora sp. ATCC PTA-5024 TaxID=316330 RepID=UPI0018DE555F|nr:ATP-binding domain-containing protein [Microbispora sp. ATCC PTA-5024]
MDTNMPLDVVYGASRNRGAAQALADELRKVVQDGTVYLAYPVLATADERVEVDALLVSQEHGLVAFLLADDIPTNDESWEEIAAKQDRLYAVLEGHLRRYEGLREGRRLAVTPNTATIFPAPVQGQPLTAEGFFGDMDAVRGFVQGLDPISAKVERSLHAALQRVSTMKPPKKRSGVETSTSRGAVLKEIERNIANLDRWQKAAAIESPEGPQRIRGLAGSGKTVVLALKAAYWHAQNPEWRIAVTFHTRALYQQFSDLITRFSFEHSNDRPDPTFLQIIHSWGSPSRPGVYSLIASALGEMPKNWNYARDKYGQEGAFQGICRELLEVAETREIKPIFDAILIDEAQDLPPEFFQLVYQFTKDPKRIVWGFDELQKLSESAMPSTDELFGVGPSGERLVSLENLPNSPRRDIVLPVCYRNTPWALATAHALGIGVYRDGGLLQHPDNPGLWRDIGYNVVRGSLAGGQHVALERSRDSSPEYFNSLLNAPDAVSINSFAGEDEQDAWVARQIAINLAEDELEPDDILIVLPDAYRAQSRAPRLMRELRRHQISCHLVGVNTSLDGVFVPGSVAIAHIYRAKGNEAPMVYAIDSQHAGYGANLVTRRNMLFTAITRSRAWVRITGWGEKMDLIASEAQAVADRNFLLEFNVPTVEELRSLRHIHRDRSPEDEVSMRKATEGLAAFLEAIDRGDMEWRDLPASLRTRLVTSLQIEDSSDNDA